MSELTPVLGVVAPPFLSIGRLSSEVPAAEFGLLLTQLQAVALAAQAQGTLPAPPELELTSPVSNPALPAMAPQVAPIRTAHLAKPSRPVDAPSALRERENLKRTRNIPSDKPADREPAETLSVPILEGPSVPMTATPCSFGPESTGPISAPTVPADTPQVVQDQRPLPETPTGPVAPNRPAQLAAPRDRENPKKSPEPAETLSVPILEGPSVPVTATPCSFGPESTGPISAPTVPADTPVVMQGQEMAGPPVALAGPVQLADLSPPIHVTAAALVPQMPESTGKVNPTELSLSTVLAHRDPIVRLDMASLEQLLTNSSVKVTQWPAVLPPAISEPEAVTIQPRLPAQSTAPSPSGLDTAPEGTIAGRQPGASELPGGREILHVPAQINDSSASIARPPEPNLEGEGSPDQTGQTRDHNPAPPAPESGNHGHQDEASRECSTPAPPAPFPSHPAEGQEDGTQRMWRRHQSRQLLQQNRHMSLRLESDTLGEVSAQLEIEAGGQWTASLMVRDSYAEERLTRQLEQLQDRPLVTGSGLSSFSTSLMQPDQGEIGQRFRSPAPKKVVRAPNFRDHLPIERSSGGTPSVGPFQQPGSVNIRV